MYNPFENWSVTGTWAEHMPYSLGGIDQPLTYGTPLRAPAAGTLRTSGGSGELRAGLVGSAGRRAILVLDESVLTLFAIALQHLSRFAPEGHYEEGEIIGWSGASTIRSNGTVNEYGGDVHLHHHGLTKSGVRVDWRGFIPYAPAEIAVSVAGVATTTLIIEPKEETLKVYANAEVAQAWVVGGAGTWREIPTGYADHAIAAFGPVVKLSNVAFDLARKICRGESYGG